MHEIVRQIKDKAHQLGFMQVGICDAEPLTEEENRLNTWLNWGYQGSMEWMARTKSQRSAPASYFPEAKSIVIVAHNYFRTNESVYVPSNQGNISIYARGRDYHKVLKKKLKELLDKIQALLPDSKGRICVDSFPIMEKPAAVKAGIGWIGKHSNLIIKGKGSYFFLGEILLSQKLPPDDRLTEDYCGSCDKCQQACPTDALNQPYVLDSNKCISYLTIEHDGEIDAGLQEKMGNWIFGCDICQEVCPWNSFSRNTPESDYASRILEDFMDLENLKGLTKDEFTNAFASTPVMRAGYDNFMRNVMIAIRNRDEKG